MTLSIFPDNVGNAFETAFGLDASARPSALEWVQCLTKLEQSLSRCGRSTVHYYPTKAGKCLWCDLADISGVDMFPEALTAENAGTLPSGIDINTILYQFKKIELPSPDNFLPTAPSNLSPSPAVMEAQNSATNAKLMGVAILAAVAFLIYNMPGLLLIWLGVGAYGLSWFGKGSVDPQPFRNEYLRADKAARAAEEAYLSRIGLSELYTLKEELRVAIEEHQGIEQRLNKELSELKSNREARQRADYLDRFRIRSASISGIGPSKKATLASFGIETAADVTDWAVSRVPGFAEVMTERLVDWRRSKERRFRYNPAPLPEDAKADKDVRGKFAKRRLALEVKIHPAAVALSTAKVRTLPPDQPLLAALSERAQARCDLEALGQGIPASPALSLQAAKVAPPASPTSPSAPRRIYTPTNQIPNTGSPTCPKCSSKMVRRLARRGGNAGRHFWGCSRYPSCRGTRNV